MKKIIINIDEEKEEVTVGLGEDITVVESLQGLAQLTRVIVTNSDIKVEDIVEILQGSNLKEE